MRRPFISLVAFTAALGLIGTHPPSRAQDYSYPTTPGPAPGSTPAPAPAPTPGLRPGHIPGVGPSEPSSGQASNISPYDTRSQIAPRLPTPSAGEDTYPRRYLISARQALAAGRTGEAQEALERAETRLLDRSTPAFRTGDPSRSPLVEQIRSILAALSANDRGNAMRLLEAAIAETGQPAPPPPSAYAPPYPPPPGAYPAPYPPPGPYATPYPRY